MILKKLFVLLAIVLVLASCVGSVEKSSSEKTDYYTPQASLFDYQGIVDARAISHNKIEIDFIPAGDPTVFNHYLYVNEQTNPIEIKLETVPAVGSGIYRYVLEDLIINRAYNLKITATNLKTGAISTGEKIVENLRTFDNTTATFRGISKVTAVPGSASSSAIVKWNAALFEGAISAAPYDPVYYELIYISENGGYANINNTTYSGDDRQILRVPASGSISITSHPTFQRVNGLKPDTTYYFQVRAVHKAWDDLYKLDSTNIPVKREQNSLFVSYKTGSATSFADFNKAGLELSNAPSDGAFTKIRMNWPDGEGNFIGYRVFVKQYSGVSIDNDDELSQVDLDPASGKLQTPCVLVSEGEGLVQTSLPIAVRDDPSKIGCFDIPATVTNIEVGNLNAYTGYHVKVALCRDAECSVQDSASTPGILSTVKWEYTEPQLAPFDGINFLTQSQDPANLDRVGIEYNPPVTAIGYADTLEVYCIDPANYNNAVPFLTNSLPISTGPNAGVVPRCDNLAIETSAGGDLNTLNSFNSITSTGKLTVLNVKNIPNPDAYYCFGITPAITNATGAPGDVRLDPSQWIIRCIAPEVKAPTVKEFPGIVGGCSVNENNFTVNWNVPSGGIYQDYTVFFKEKDTKVFNFGDAIAGDPTYTKVENINSLSYTRSGVDPGKTYQVGVLTVARSGTDVFYSESNLETVDCDIPVPTATFTEWTRVLALGPKIDGRIPSIQDNSDDNDWPTIRMSGTSGNSFYESRMFEAITQEGIPYEVDANDFTSFLMPPGDTSTTLVPNNPTTADFAPSADGLAASQTGIISLAWKEVSLDFLQTEYYSGQDAQTGVDRATRTFGYKIYRSSDYGLTWQNLTPDRVISTVPYTYKERSNSADITERMGFFTDYSVQYLAENRDIAKARVYLYKIVPVYNGLELNYNDNSSSPHHMMKVTLPPPNMALIHRQMANRQKCYELGKKDLMEHGNHYVCPFNGVGANARTFPWQLGQTVIDQGGDLLVDRFQLGCNITRGAITGGTISNAYKDGDSYFFTDRPDYSTSSKTFFGDFKGIANNSNVFRGCAQIDPNIGGANPYANSGSGISSGSSLNDSADPYAGVDPTYKKVIFGDCIGDSSAEALPRNYVASANQYNVIYQYNMPGAYGGNPLNLPDYDPYTIDVDYPQFANDAAAGPGLYGKEFSRHTLAIAEQFAVYYSALNQDQAPNTLPPFGPGYDSTASDKHLYDSSTWYGTPSCFINIASIGAGSDPGNDYWRTRWFSTPHLSRTVFYNDTETTVNGGIENILEKTLSEITSSKALYDDWKAVEAEKGYKAPAQTFWDKDRVHQDMPISRVFSSNNAKLPPLVGFSAAKYNQICGTYKVQVGVKSESDTSAFSPFGAPKKKRLLNRSEYIAAAAFPDSFDDNLIKQLEVGDDTALINSNPAKACAGPDKAMLDRPLVVNSNLTDNYASTKATDIRFASGSGRLDSLEHTESCTSRYGIQDLVGQVDHLSSDMLFCDYNRNYMEIYFGEVIGGIGSIANSIAYPYADPVSLDPIAGVGGVLSSAPIKFPGMTVDPDGAGSTWTAYDDTASGGTAGMQRINNKIWRYVAADSGYCSIVDTDKARVDTPYNFRDFSGIFKNILNPDGTLNTDVAKTRNSIQIEAPNTMRNGDGLFMNFGESNLGPSMRLNGSLSLSSADAGMSGKYFSPITGLPLTCNNYGASDSCGPDSSDNLEYSIPAFSTNFAGGAIPPEVNIPDFPVGSSKITTYGTAEIHEQTNFNVITRTFTPPIQGGVMITELEKGAEPAKIDLSALTTGTTFSYYHTMWKIPRGTSFRFRNGGTGRYGLTFGDHSIKSTGRCSVLINTDE